MPYEFSKMFFIARRAAERRSEGEAAQLRRRSLLFAGMAGLAVLALSRPSPAANTYSIRPELPGMGASLRTTVDFPNSYAPGTIVVVPGQHELFRVIDATKADRYTISVGRDGFGWSGRVTVGAKREWPSWHPPADMRARSPDLPAEVPPGPYNPLGARALYLYRDGRDTLYRIHGTNNPDGVGVDGTSGCFRLTNTDIIDLYERVPIGTLVIVE